MKGWPSAEGVEDIAFHSESAEDFVEDAMARFRRCTPCAVRTDATVRAFAVEHGSDYGSRYVCEACAREVPADRLEPLEDFFQRVVAQDAAVRLKGE